MKHKINIRGVMVPNSYKTYYEYFGEDCTCPDDVQQVIDAFREGDEIEVFINSPGGVIDVGSEIYTLLKGKKENIKIYITGEACSAASVAAMAAHCEMSPTALLMVHCVSTYAGGNHNDMEHVAETLRTADKALCSAYMIKSGMSENDVLEMMEHETWLTAQQALEKGLIDAIMFEEREPEIMVAGPLFKLPTEEQLQTVNQLMQQGEVKKVDTTACLAQYNLLKLKEDKL